MAAMRFFASSARFFLGELQRRFDLTGDDLAVRGDGACHVALPNERARGHATLDRARLCAARLHEPDDGGVLAERQENARVGLGEGDLLAVDLGALDQRTRITQAPQRFERTDLHVECT